MLSGLRSSGGKYFIQQETRPILLGAEHGFAAGTGGGREVAAGLRWSRVVRGETILGEGNSTRFRLTRNPGHHQEILGHRGRTLD